jgi:hypothetical protein
MFADNSAVLNNTRLTEGHRRVVDTPASYSEGLVFKSRLGDRLSWLRDFVIFLSLSKQLLG